MKSLMTQGLELAVVQIKIKTTNLVAVDGYLYHKIIFIIHVFLLCITSLLACNVYQTALSLTMLVQANTEEQHMHYDH
jgi:hypothetical protein